MTSSPTFPAIFPPPCGSGPYEEDNRIFTPEAMDEADAELAQTAVVLLAA